MPLTENLRLITNGESVNLLMGRGEECQLAIDTYKNRSEEEQTDTEITNAIIVRMHISDNL